MDIYHEYSSYKAVDGSSLQYSSLGSPLGDTICPTEEFLWSHLDFKAHSLGSFRSEYQATWPSSP